jgi:hypothetical protein
MNTEEAKSTAVSALSKLALDQKLYALALLSHNLTISGRLVYSERSDDRETVKKLYSLNEIQHRLTSQMMHIALKEDNIPDKTFVNTLYSFAQQGECESELTIAFKHTLAVMQNRT